MLWGSDHSRMRMSCYFLSHKTTAYGNARINSDMMGYRTT